MTKAETHPIFSKLSGSLDDDHYIRTTKSGKMIISRKPKFRNRQFSKAQLNVQNRTREATAYAQVASKENPIYAKLAKGTDLNAHNIAARDWHRPPVIHRIEWHEGEVRAIVRDDVLVTKVSVSILDEYGQPLEQGDAELKLGYVWVYTAQNKGVIVVEGYDLPGNVACQEFRPEDGVSVWERTSSR